MITRQIVVAVPPSGYPTEETFRIQEVELPAPGPGQVLVRTRYLSVDPWHMGQIRVPERLVPGDAVGEVIAFNDSNLAVGDHVQGLFGWQTHAVADGQGLRKLDPGLRPASAALGLVGLTGLTAYFGLLEFGRPQPGETILVSGAAGAVGNVVGQIAKLYGCRVVGVAGSGEKVDLLVNELGFDAAFNYKTVDDYEAKLKELCPDGIDIYFDNVGGTLLDAAILSLRFGGRIVICGQISQYHLTQRPMGPRLLGRLMHTQGRIQGFIVEQFTDRFGAGLAQLTEWLAAGKLRVLESVVDGFEETPRAFIAMMRGQNVGKQVVRL